MPLTGLTNARPETVAIVERLEALRSELPLDPFEFMEWDPPAEYAAINAVD